MLRTPADSELDDSDMSRSPPGPGPDPQSSPPDSLSERSVRYLSEIDGRSVRNALSRHGLPDPGAPARLLAALLDAEPAPGVPPPQPLPVGPELR
jgi:hypothetical protein